MITNTLGAQAHYIPPAIIPPQPKAPHLIITDNHVCASSHSNCRSNLVKEKKKEKNTGAYAVYTPDEDERVNSFLCTHLLTGVDTSELTDLLKAQSGQIHAGFLTFATAPTFPRPHFSEDVGA